MAKPGERVLVVSQHLIDGATLAHGFNTLYSISLLDHLWQSARLIPRDLAERSPEWRQLIVYSMVRHGEDLLLARRRGNGDAPAGLEDMYCVGFGGHITSDDVEAASNSGMSVFDWSARRELREEIDCDTLADEELGMSLWGLLNDQSNEMGRLHLGVVYVANVVRPVSVRMHAELSDDVSVMCAPLEIHRRSLFMENWSSILLHEYLKSSKNESVSERA